MLAAELNYFISQSYLIHIERITLAHAHIVVWHKACNNIKNNIYNKFIYLTHKRKARRK